MAFTVRPYPEWSWSQSREQLFRECPRKYYYHYYASHNGWMREASVEAQTAYRLKQMANLYLVLGDVLHQMAERMLNEWNEKRRLLTEDEVVRQLRSRLNQAYKDSLQVEAWKSAPKKRVMLHEMYYGGELPAQRVEQIKQRMRLCAEGLLNCRTMRELADNPDLKIAEVEQLKTFPVGDTPVYVKMDALLEERAGSGHRWTMVDWKTGLEAEKNEEQLILYALYLQEARGISPENLELRVEYLLSGETVVVRADDEAIARMREAVLASMAEMRACLADPANNAPKPKEAFAARPRRETCRGCNFRELCEEKMI